MKVDLSEFRTAYLAEVDEHLAAVRQRLVSADAAVRAGQSCGRDLRELLRLVHTVKGLSAMVGVEPVVLVAHRLESVLRSAERAGGKLSPRALEALVDGTTAIESRVRAVASDAAVPDAPPALLAELDALERAAEPAATPPAAALLDPEIDARLSASEREQLVGGAAGGRRAVRVDFVPTREKAGAGLSITTVRQRISALAEIVKIVPVATSATVAQGGLLFALLVLTERTDEELAEAVGGDVQVVHLLVDPGVVAAAPTSPSLPAADDAPRTELPPFVPDDEGPSGGVLRVEVSRVDDAIEKLSTLVVTRSRLARAVAALAAAGAPTRELEAILSDHARQLRDLRGAILRVRMVPMTAVLDRLPLLVRSLGRTTGKDVRLDVQGAGAELDKTVAERIFPALVHLLRNAVDHGLESAEERVRHGKPPAGTIAVSCANEGNRTVEIRIRDDGRGIDRERVGARAGRSAIEDDAALLDVLCRPGFSTRDAVGETSGRGVGMDVVRRIVVDGLGGDLSVETVAGQGTTFVVRVPLTISIVDTFTVRCGDERFAVPVPIVEEILEIDPAGLVASPRPGGGTTRLLVRRGESVPVVELREALGLSAAAVAGRHALLVRRTRREPVAFAVDRVLGQQEAVVRPLGDALVSVGGVAGSTDLGDGVATLVIDLVALSARLAGRSEAA